MRFLASLIALAFVGCSTTHHPTTQAKTTRPESTALNKPIPVPPEMERRDIQDPDPYLYPEGQ